MNIKYHILLPSRCFSITISFVYILFSIIICVAYWHNFFFKVFSDILIWSALRLKGFHLFTIFPSSSAIRWRFSSSWWRFGKYWLKELQDTLLTIKHVNFPLRSCTFRIITFLESGEWGARIYLQTFPLKWGGFGGLCWGLGCYWELRVFANSCFLSVLILSISPSLSISY